MRSPVVWLHAGKFYVNTSKLDSRPFYEAGALALHEAIPGHHTQTMLAAESEELPPFRRFMDDRRYFEAPGRFPIEGAFIEGWGLYAEYLGEASDGKTTTHSPTLSHPLTLSSIQTLTHRSTHLCGMHFSTLAYSSALSLGLTPV